MKSLRVLCRYSSTTSSASISGTGTASGNIKSFSEIPSVSGVLPLLGTAWWYWPIVGKYPRDKLQHAAMDMHRKYGNICKEQLGGRYPLVHLFDPDDFKKVYDNEGRTPFRIGASAFQKYRSSRPQWYSNNGFLVLQGEEWYKYRSKTQPYTLKPKVIMSYLPSMNDVVNETMDLIREHQKQGEPWDCLRLLYKWSLESVLFVVLDSRLGCLRRTLPKDSDAYEIINSMDAIFHGMQVFGYRLPLWRYVRTPTYAKFEKAMDVFTERIFKNIKQAAEIMKKNEAVPVTILQHLLARDDMEFNDVVTLMSDFLLGGADTTSNSASFFLYNMAANPEKQQKAYEEAYKVTGGDPNYEVTPETLNNIPYIKSCLRESLRLFPTISGVYRKFDHDVVFSGYNVPKGTVVFTEFYVSGRSPKYFENPEKFEPERWVNKAEEQHAFASLPFSFGPRMCIGRRVAELELWTLMIKVLMNFKLSYKGKPFDFKGKLVNTPDQPCNFDFQPRSHK